MLLIAACGTNPAGEFVARELVHEQNLEALYAFGKRLEHTEAGYMKPCPCGEETT